jgi:hypothetical protein
MAARLTAAELNPLVGVAVPPSAVADRVGREVDAPLPCAVLRCQELEDDGRNGFMSKRFGGGGWRDVWWPTQRDLRHVRLTYHPPASSTFLSEQTSHQQPANSTFLSEQISTSHQPDEQVVNGQLPNATAARRSGSRRRRAVPAGLSKKRGGTRGKKE